MAYDFPAAPVLNQVFGNYTYNGMGWAITPGGGGGTPVDAYTKAESDANFVNVPGDTMAGALAISTASYPALYLTDTAAAASKAIRVGPTNALEVVNSANSGTPLTLSDTGTLQATGASGGVVATAPFPSFVLNRTDPTLPGHIVGQLNGATRWTMILGNADGGGNTGSDFNINRIMDDGSNPEPVTGVFHINRASGEATFAGTVKVKNAGPILSLEKTAFNSNATINGTLNGVPRWWLTLGDMAAEGAGNFGSNFTVSRCNDAGVVIDSPLQIRRDSGYVYMVNSLSIGSFDRYSSLTIGKGPGFTGDILFQNNSATRWAIQCDAIPDAGESGSNFSIGRYNTAGVYVGPVLMIARDTAITTFYNQIQLYDFNNRWQLDGQLVIGSASAWKPGGGEWVDLSDARTKTVSGPYESGLDAILQLNPVRYQFKGNASTHSPELSSHRDVLDREFIGLVAQEAEGPMPELVTQVSGFIDGAAVTDLRAMDASALTYALVNAVKELSAKVTALEAQLAAR